MCDAARQHRGAAAAEAALGACHGVEALTSMLCGVQLQLARCLADGQCLEDLVCLNLCNNRKDEQACQVRQRGAAMQAPTWPACAGASHVVHPSMLRCCGLAHSSQLLNALPCCMGRR